MSLRLLATLAPGALATLLTAAGVLLFSLAPAERVPTGLHLEETYPYLAIPVSLGIVGAAVAWRHPANPIGWLLSMAAVLAGLEYLTGGYATYGWVSGRGLPYADVAAWAYAWGATATSLYLIPVLFLFPDGHLRSRRDGVGLIAGTAAIISFAAVFAARPGPLMGLPFVQNPYGWREGEGVLDLVLAVASVLALAAVISAISSLRDRSRGARWLERQQLKWLYGGAGLYLAMNALAGPIFLGETLGISVDPTLRYLARLSGGLSLTIFPIAVGIAVLRHRLYDIDLVIHRTLVYGGVSAILAATYLAAVISLQAALRPFTAGSDLAVAGSTLVVVALFQPLRRHVQDLVDRRFYRSRYDATRMLDAFTARLRDEVALESVEADLLGVIGATLRPAHATLWLRQDPVTLSGRSLRRKDSR